MLFFSSIFVPKKDCMDPEIRTVWPLMYVESLTSISMLVSCLGMCALALKNSLFSQDQKFSFSLS
jgi:hypothetical protein